MSKTDTRILICSCEGTMPLDPAKIAKGLGSEAVSASTHLCRTQIERFASAADQPGKLLVACTQEAPLFMEAAELKEAKADLIFTNIRERAGWSDDARSASPKIAALLAEAQVEAKPTAALPVQSDGRVVVFGKADQAFAAARALSDRMAVTCVVDTLEGILPPSVVDMALFVGRLGGASGHVGNFAVRFFDVAAPSPSSRAHLLAGPSKAEQQFEADVILDLSGRMPLFPGRPPRDGYIRAEPSDAVAIQKAIMETADLVGEFEKPRYIKVDTDLCAHSRNNITGCTRCLDACPTSALSPAGDFVQVDELACSGHGACNSVCPTGAIQYQVPRARDLNERLRALLSAYLKADGKQPVLLLHDAKGLEVIEVSARLGRGLPANVLPMELNEVTTAGVDFLLSAFAMGASRVVMLATEAQRDDVAHLEAAAELASAIAKGLAYGEDLCSLLVLSDPDALEEALRLEVEDGPPHAGFMAMGSKRQTMSLALVHLHEHAPVPTDVIALPAGAPLGAVHVNAEGCTLCLSCVGVCPTNALGDNPDKPQLSFLERDCVQCGLCAATCPENVITLEPRVSFIERDTRRSLKEEEPFACIVCGKEFGTKSSIETVLGKLSGHSMFAGTDRLKLIQMCADCRVFEQAKVADGLVQAPPPPRTRTTEDYIRERAERQAADAAKPDKS